MSYILDALRKSQAERQGATLRTSTDENGARALTQLRRGRWLAAMGLALLVINVLVAGFLYLRKETNQVVPAVSSHLETSVTARHVPVAAQQQLPPSKVVVSLEPLNGSESVLMEPNVDLPATDSSRDIDMEQAYEQQRRTWSRNAPAFAQVAPVAVAAQHLTNTGDSSAEPRSEINAAASSAPKSETFPATNNAARQDEKYGALPSFMESALAKDERFAGVKIDVHVYATLPSQRFVLINMKKYHEGETTDAGLALNAITPEGAIVSYQGQQYKLLPQ